MCVFPCNKPISLPYHGSTFTRLQFVSELVDAWQWRWGRGSGGSGGSGGGGWSGRSGGGVQGLSSSSSSSSSSSDMDVVVDLSTALGESDEERGDTGGDRGGGGRGRGRGGGWDDGWDISPLADRWRQRLDLARDQCERHFDRIEPLLALRSAGWRAILHSFTPSPSSSSSSSYSPSSSSSLSSSSSSSSSSRMRGMQHFAAHLGDIVGCARKAKQLPVATR